MTTTPTLAEAIAVVRAMANTEQSLSTYVGMAAGMAAAHGKQAAALRLVADMAERTAFAERVAEGRWTLVLERLAAPVDLAAENARLRAALGKGQAGHVDHVLHRFFAVRAGAGPALARVEVAPELAMHAPVMLTARTLLGLVRENNLHRSREHCDSPG